MRQSFWDSKIGRLLSVLLSLAVVSLLVGWCPLTAVGTGWFGLEQPWGTLVNIVVALIAFPVLGYLAYLLVLLFFAVFARDKIDWR